MKKTLLILLALVFPFSAHADTLKVTAWNIEWLGSHERNIRNEADYKELARYAKQLNADVIALQEVDGADYAKKVFGDEYDYYFSTKDWVQRVGVAVRKSAGYDVKSIEYKALDVGRVRHGMDIIMTKGDKQLRLLAVHLKSGCFDLPLDSKSIAAMPAEDDRQERRKIACDILGKQIEPLESWIDARASEGIPFMVLGDFNRRFVKDIANKQPEDAGLWQAIDDEGNEALWSPTLEKESACWGGYYKDYIDHIVMDVNARAKYVEDSFEQLVFEPEYTKEISSKLSDHCPISVKLTL
ncbi:endonuclease/exonuclease/phosphatase family protein [Aliikangiella marina]|uniref:endonuclease/exonuclease/phosphatase family protein n=1 Tax=Aliikangiella marina TaxID=1712262 RepID=UPI001AEE6DF8|nr:endonuclease/exonuclease/phosphatase family protein [Aliikangiella marina]